MTENLSITQLRTFIWVATLGSFRKTADKMKTTQPAISSRIAKLEEMLGARLFDRDTGSIQITPEGEALRPHAENMIRTAERLSDIIKGDSATVGTLSMGVTEYAVSTWLPDFLEAAPRIFPNVEISLMVDKSHDLNRELSTRGLDLAIVNDPLKDHRIDNRVFTTIDHCWVAAPSLGLKTSRAINLFELSKYPIITDTKTSKIYMELNGCIRKNNLGNFQLFPCNSYSSAKHLIEQGAGIGILPEGFIETELQNGSLQKIICDWNPPPLIFMGSYINSPKKLLAERVVQFAQTLL